MLKHGMKNVKYFKKIEKKDITFHSFYFHFTNHLHLLEFLIKSGPKVYDGYFEKKHSLIDKKISKLNKLEKKELDRITNARLKNTHKKINLKFEKVQNITLEHSQLHFHINNWRPFVLEMGLIFLITKFEEFLQTQLKLIYQKHPEMLKNKGIVYGETIGKSDQDLLEEVIEKQVKDVIGEDIDSIHHYFLKQTKLDLSKNKKWVDFTERFYRRNTIIHNSGIPDKTYYEKTKSNKKKLLIISESYFIKSLDLFGMFGHEMTDFFEKKYGLKKFHKDKIDFIDSGSFKNPKTSK